MVARRLAGVIRSLAAVGQELRSRACLGFTHPQPAQPTTVGKRACLWAYDLALDLAEVEHRIATLKARSVKGTTGTQASFLELFGGDHAKVRQLEKRVAEKLGFDFTYAITGQTYSRKVDAQVLDTLNVIAKHLREELPFMATENILMSAVAAGGDRQTLHERIRQHSQAAAAVVKEQGAANDLIARLKADSAFAAADIDAAINPATLTG